MATKKNNKKKSTNKVSAKVIKNNISTASNKKTEVKPKETKKTEVKEEVKTTKPVEKKTTVKKQTPKKETKKHESNKVEVKKETIKPEAKEPKKEVTKTKVKESIKKEAPKKKEKIKTKENESVKVTPPTPKKEEVKTEEKKTKKRKRKHKKKTEEVFKLPKKEQLFVLEGNQLKKPIIDTSNKCKVEEPTLKKQGKKRYNKTERKEIVEHDDYSEMCANKFKYKKDKIYLWPLVFIGNRFKVMIFDMARLKKRLKYGTFRDKFLILIMVFLIIGCICGILFMGYVVINAPEVSKKALYSTSSTVLYDVNGNEFARLGAQNREVISYDRLPEVLVDAIVATEDSRFFQHNGVDLARFSKAVIGQLAGRSDAGGGSTLTMQVSKLVATSTVDSGIQGIIRKFTDIYLSVFVLEKQYAKEEILEFYVNIPYLGAAYGVEQASQAYFGKSASELTLPEAATIAGLFQAPSSYNPYNYPEKANNRKNIVLNLMYRHGYISAEERDAAKQVHVQDLLVSNPESAGINKYIAFVDTVVAEVKQRTNTNPYATSMNIYTTMDPKKQDVVNDIENGVTYSWVNEHPQAGIAVLSVKNGSIVAIGAGRNKTTESSYNYATQISRHPGSTAKPVIDYGPAIEYLGWGTSQTVVDEKYEYTGGGMIRNWDNGYKGVITIKEALAQSRNVPALLTFQQTTSDQKMKFATGLGWYPEVGNGYTYDENPDEYMKGQLLETDSIGGFEGVSPLQSAAAYAAFARGGVYIEPYSFTSLEYTESGEKYQVKPEKRTVMSEDTAYIITQILKYAVTSGNISAGYVAGTDLAAKTGTSTVDASIRQALGITGSIIGDAWENVYSPDYSISTWYGYDKITKEHWLSNNEGGNARKAITKALVKGIMEPNSTFKKPATVETATVELQTDPLQLASACTPDWLKETSYFKDGTAPGSESERFAKLSNPSNLKVEAKGTTVALTWSAANEPNAYKQDWIRDYFTKSKIYKYWAEEMIGRRIADNNNIFGQFGYRVYKTNNGTTTDLGFTTNTYMTVSADYGETTYKVVASYSNFSCNQSDGITSKITNDVKVDPSDNYKISFNGKSCVSYDEYNSIGSDSISSKVTITKNGTEIKSLSSEGLVVTATVYDESGNQTSLSRDDSKTFTIKFTLQTYNKSTITTTSIRVGSTC